MTDQPAATDETSEPPVSRVRRRASRPAGSAGSAEAPTVLDIAIPSTASRTSGEASEKFNVVKAVRPSATARVPQRQPRRTLVAAIGLAVAAVLAATLAGGTWFLWNGNTEIQATQDRDQRFVDTAKQTVVNMFSYTQNTIDESVNRFVNGIGPGPLRDMMNQSNNAENLKYLFKQTQANSEAVITAAALESIDNTSNIAKVLVTVRVTLTDINGVNQPSTPYRQRVFIREDDNGTMSAYDIKYPDGGN